MPVLFAVRLSSTPYPVEHAPIADAERVGEIRRLDCHSYDTCLNMAVDASWPGFACHRCSAYNPKSIDELRNEAEACRVAMAARRR